MAQHCKTNRLEQGSCRIFGQVWFCKHVWVVSCRDTMHVLGQQRPAPILYIVNACYCMFAVWFAMLLTTSVRFSQQQAFAMERDPASSANVVDLRNWCKALLVGVFPQISDRPGRRSSKLGTAASGQKCQVRAGGVRSVQEEALHQQQVGQPVRMAGSCLLVHF